MELINSSVDLAIIEAYIPNPELFQISEHMVEYLTWF
jgi:hypothetical protein